MIAYQRGGARAPAKQRKEAPTQSRPRLGPSRSSAATSHQRPMPQAAAARSSNGAACQCVCPSSASASERRAPRWCRHLRLPPLWMDASRQLPPTLQGRRHHNTYAATFDERYPHPSQHSALHPALCSPAWHEARRSSLPMRMRIGWRQKGCACVLAVREGGGVRRSASGGCPRRIHPAVLSPGPSWLSQYPLLTYALVLVCWPCAKGGGSDATRIGGMSSEGSTRQFCRRAPLGFLNASPVNLCA